MMKRKPFTKRLLSLVLAFVMLVGVIPVTSLAAETEEHEHSVETQTSEQTAEPQAAAQPKAEPQATPTVEYTFIVHYNLGASDVQNVFFELTETQTTKYPETAFTLQPALDMITRNGYTLRGWYDAPDGTGKKYRTSDALFMTADDSGKTTYEKTIYAVWDANSEVTYQILFDDGVDDNSVTGMPDNLSFGPTTEKKHQFMIPRVYPERVKYDFLGWRDSKGSLWRPSWYPELTSTSPVMNLTADWQAHASHQWVYTMDSDGKDGTHSATCTVTWSNGTVKCEEILDKVPHTWTSETTKSATFTEPGIRTYTCTKCGATYEEEIPVVVPGPLSLSDVQRVNQGRYVWIVENYNVNADGTGGAPKWFPNSNDREESIKKPTSTDQYTITDPAYDAATDAYYCTLTIKKEAIAGWLEDFNYDEVWNPDWAHSHYKSLQDFTYVLAKTAPTMGWAIDKTRSGFTGNDQFGKAIFVVHTTHKGGTHAKWVAYPEEGVERVRCEHNWKERTDAYQCKVMIERPITPTVEQISPAFDGVTITVNGKEVELIPGSIYVVPGASSTDAGWRLRTEIDASMYLTSKCEALAKGQDKKPAVFFIWTPSQDGNGGSWVPQTTTLDIKTEESHNFTDWVVTTAATCKDPGVEMRICQDCGHKESREIPATGTHTWGEWEVVTEATCGKDGKKTRTCTACGETETEIIPKTEQHVWNEGRYQTKPSPWKDGSWIKSCTVCRTTKIDPIPKLEEYELPAKPTEEDMLGLKYKLTMKEFYEADFSSGKPKMCYQGRDVSNVLLAGTFEIGEVYEQDEAFYVNVTINKLDPYFQIFTDKFNTETVKYVPNATYNKDAYVLQLEYDGFDYPYATISWHVARNLTDTSYLWLDHVHYTTGSWTTVKKATCTEDGIRSAVCSHWYQNKTKPSTNARYLCKETFEEVIPATGHKWGEWTVEGENHVRECSVCHEKETEAHKWDKGVVTTAPHLDSEGEKTFTCSVCSGTKTEVMPVPAPITNEIVEHERQPGYIYVLENWKPTGAPAYAGNINKVDGARQIKSRRLIPGTYEIGEPYEEDGKFYCVVTITDTQAYLAAFQAQYPGITWKIDTENCRTSYRYLLEYIGYDYPSDPCCWRYTRSLKDENGSDTDRLWIKHEHYTTGEWKVTKEATCLEDGEKTAVCSHNGRTESWSSIYKCKTTMTETIPATGEHSWGEWEVTTEATCEAEGEKTRTCSVCNETETEKIAALGHKWDEGKVTTEATCTKEGVKTFTCQNDSTHTKTEAIPVKEHTYSKWESDETNHWRKCTECGKKQTGKHKDIDNNGICDVCGRNVGKSDAAPKTGDPAPVKAVVTVLVISAVAVGAIALYLFLKKKKATDQ